MSYQIHVHVRGAHSGLSEWKALRNSGSAKPYAFETRDEAERVARMCYPSADSSQVRIVEE